MIGIWSRISVTYHYRGKTWSIHIPYNMENCNNADFQRYLFDNCLGLYRYKFDDYNITIDEISKYNFDATIEKK